MGEITLFSGYSQGENRTTNYCLLVLKMLYEENPKFLGETLTQLVGDVLSALVGVSFQQQVRKASGIPDGLIVQEALRVHIETKRSDWFYDEQLERHLDDLATESGTRVLIALSNFETNEADRFAAIRTRCESKYENRILFKAVSFEEFLAALPEDKVSKNLADAIADFREYLEEEDLLPRWRTLLDVVNCSGWGEETSEHRVYICPATGGAYNHSRAKYFGLYSKKTVSRISLIEAVVDVGDDGATQLKWKNVKESDVVLAERARELRSALRASYEGPLRVFLLGEMYETDYRKTSAGGMQQSKRYFDVREHGVQDAAALAQALRGRSWE
jgi:hypothetical protein